MILTVGVLALAAMAVLVWTSVGRDVLRVGYVTITRKPSLGVEKDLRTPDVSSRRKGVVHLVMVDHVDPGLVLVVLRLNDGGQWISTIRADQHGFGVQRLDSWRQGARRVVVVERSRAHEVIFRPLGRPIRPDEGRGTRGFNSEAVVKSTPQADVISPGADDRSRDRGQIPRLRLLFAFAMGAISIVSSVVLMCTDGLDAGVSWTHHAGVSAAPLLLVAGALLAISIALPPTGTTALLRVVTITAFTTWGLSQLLPNTGAGTLLDDFAILLFVIDTGVFAAFQFDGPAQNPQGW